MLQQFIFRGHRSVWFLLACRFAKFDTSVCNFCNWLSRDKIEIFCEHDMLPACILYNYYETRPSCLLELFASTVSCFLSWISYLVSSSFTCSFTLRKFLGSIWLSLCVSSSMFILGFILFVLAPHHPNVTASAQVC